MPPHHTFNLSHPKLDKLFRRVQSTSAAHTVMMVDGWDDYGVVEKALDNYLKAQEEYWEEQKRMLRLEGVMG